MAQPPIIKRYTRRADRAGWLQVRLEPVTPTGRTDEFTGLCEYTEVAILGAKAGRTYFKIMDGNIAVGRKASLKTPNAALYLSTRGPGGAATVYVKYKGVPVDHKSDVQNIVIRQQWAEVSFDGKTARVTLNSSWGGSYTPILAGTHAILSPDYSHGQTVPTHRYVSASPGMIGNDTWFPIGLNDSLNNSRRYLHVGHISEGCVTMYELKMWNALYSYLISHRVAGSRGLRVGRLIVSK